LPPLREPSLPPDPNLRFLRWNRPLAELQLSQAIRSVSHLVLARDRLMFRLPNFRTRRSEWGCPPTRLPPARFFGLRCFTTGAALVKRRRSPALRPSRHRRDQKTFSAGPRSFSAKEFWFRKGSTLLVQPVADSRYGRIAGKVSGSCSMLNLTESRRLQSVPRARCANPFSG
jgi:hypothetical protein